MSSVVFLRAANVGGFQTFRPSETAGRVRGFRIRSIGAAGTFVVVGNSPPSNVRTELLRVLPIRPSITIIPGHELLELLADPRWVAPSTDSGIRRSVSILESIPLRAPKLPLTRPSQGPWAVRLLGASGRFVVAERRRTAGRPLYPNPIVEREFDVPATTRDWSTLERIGEILRRPDR